MESIFDKKIVLDEKAAERLANAPVVSCSFKGEKERVIRNTKEMQKWVSSLTSRE